MRFRNAKPFGATRILRVHAVGIGRFEVRDGDDSLLGTSHDEVKAIWNAVLAADLLSGRGYCVHVLVRHLGNTTEEYVAKPSGAPTKAGQ